jgi:hypothetical protein
MLQAAAVARENIQNCVVGTLADMNATQVCGVGGARLRLHFPTHYLLPQCLRSQTLEANLHMYTPTHTLSLE